MEGIEIISGDIQKSC